jgi:NADH-quinone oxidoreductase subunit N
MQLNLATIGAEIALASTGLLVLMADLFTDEKKKWILVAISVLGILVTGYLVMGQFDLENGKLLIGDNGLQIDPDNIVMGFAGDGPVMVDNFSVMFRLIFLLGLLLAIFLSYHYLRREDRPVGEYLVLIIFCTLGMMLMASAADLLTLFLGLETLSIPIYVLAGYNRNKLRSNEASLKYLVMGAFASAFLLYGMAFLFGASGTTRLTGIANALAGGGAETNLFMMIGLALFFIGFVFKAGAVPFHMWTPDVYQGAPTPITAYMSVAVKAAAIAGLLRVLLVFVPYDAIMAMLGKAVWVIAVLTMVVGNVVALHQKNIKRMLAYSSIAHVGYLLVGVLALMQMDTVQMALGGIVFYLISYTLMNMGAFGIIILVSRKGDKYEDVEDYAGLAKKFPVLAVGLSLFLFSLAGFPPTAGFFGKFYIFSAAINAGLIPLVIIGVINSLVSVVYYLRPIMMMFFKQEPEDNEDRDEIEFSFAIEFAIYFTGAAVLLLGMMPNVLLQFMGTIIGM